MSTNAHESLPDNRMFAIFVVLGSFWMGLGLGCIAEAREEGELEIVGEVAERVVGQTWRECMDAAKAANKACIDAAKDLATPEGSPAHNYDACVDACDAHLPASLDAYWDCCQACATANPEGAADYAAIAAAAEALCAPSYASAVAACGPEPTAAPIDVGSPEQSVAKPKGGGKLKGL